jgi:riboflavin kinase/FMN adenylyltransferase
VVVDGGKAAVANLGIRPTVDGEERLLEVHLFDFSGDLYGQTIKVRFVKHLREEKKFASVEELRDQISKDVVEARKFKVD